ncbi:MAG: molecular chaperone Hsp33 [Alphaproteobacteria bacterium]|nr:molecular chaperone Hsp33 [Alphaproteobacteria bacterium]
MISDNFHQTFQLESSNIRGRIVRLGSVLHDIIEAHDYPLPISHLVAETLALTLALASMLKYEGIFTLQAQGDGPVKMLISDVTTTGNTRACATYDPERIQHSREQLSALETKESSQNHLAQYLGKGYIAFTVDQGQHTDRYQGIVELKGASMVDCVQHYFAQSEQIDTGIKMAVGQRDGKWRASIIMLQDMPEEEGSAHTASGNTDEDSWRRTMILLDSCTEDEFLDPDLDADQLLIRLFHEEGIRVYDRHEVYKKCRCSAGRVENILLSMETEELEDIDKKGKIEMTCEFCSTEYSFNTKDVIKKKKKNASKET